MGSTINTNSISLNAQRNLAASQASLATSMQRLSSGMRVNSAKDDAAGLAIAERMNAQSRGMTVAARNANDAISLAQTAEGMLGKVSDTLQRMRELAVQAANAANNASDRASLDAEFSQLQDEVKRVLNNASFNNTALFGTTGSLSFQVGAGTTVDDVVDIPQQALSGGTAATSGSLTGASAPAAVLATVTDNADIAASQAAAVNAMKDIDAAIDRINAERATYGAALNRFEAIIANLAIANENTQAARGRIMDADFAMETSNLSRAQILQQAGNAMVAQANQVPQGVMVLLKG
ncbi:MAG: flagellin FliC [Betaproteobacteria bacterium]|jgi:flagellin|nr:flagellin FliC [Betaproteobacteria bacterium]